MYQVCERIEMRHLGTFNQNVHVLVDDVTYHWCFKLFPDYPLFASNHANYKSLGAALTTPFCDFMKMLVAARDAQRELVSEINFDVVIVLVSWGGESKFDIKQAEEGSAYNYENKSGIRFLIKFPAVCRYLHSLLKCCISWRMHISQNRFKLT